jgi:MFS family permease
MVERSLASFVVVMAAMAYVTEAWHVFALRAVQGLFAGYGALTLTMAADVAPKDRTAFAIGFVQTAQRLGPAIGPVLGGIVAQAGRPAARLPRDRGFYLVALVLVFLRYDERGLAACHRPRGGRVTFRSVLAFQNFVLLMAVDLRPPVHRPQLRPGAAPVRRRARHAGARVPLIAGSLFSVSPRRRGGRALLGGRMLLPVGSPRARDRLACAARGRRALMYVVAPARIVADGPTDRFGARSGWRPRRPTRPPTA